MLFRSVIPDFEALGTLKPGVSADVAIMEMKEGDFEFVDNYKGTRKGMKKLAPVATVLAGKRVKA